MLYSICLTDSSTQPEGGGQPDPLELYQICLLLPPWSMECANVRSAGPRGKLTAGRPIRQGVHNVCFMFLRTPHSPLHRHPACAHLCSLTYEGGGGLGPGGGLPPPPAGLSRTIDHHTSNFLKNQSFISKINVNFNVTRQSGRPSPR